MHGRLKDLDIFSGNTNFRGNILLFQNLQRICIAHAKTGMEIEKKLDIVMRLKKNNSKKGKISSNKEEYQIQWIVLLFTELNAYYV